MNTSDEALLAAGLNQSEAAVYLSILRLGNTTVGLVLQETGLHPQIVYRAIEQLEQMGLAVTSIQKHKKHVQVASPEKVAALVQQKLDVIKRALPDLNARRSTDDSPFVQVYKGEAAIKDLRAQGIAELKAGDTYYIIGASGDRFFEIMQKEYAKIERQRVKKGIKRRLVAFASQKESIQNQEPTTELVEYRYLPADYPALSSTNIFGDTVAQIIWSAEPVVIVIKNKDLAESYKQYFEQLWLLGSK